MPFSGLEDALANRRALFCCCQSQKEPGMPFCARCTMLLPPSLRNGAYLADTEKMEYAVAYDRARLWLEAHGQIPHQATPAEVKT